MQPTAWLSSNHAVVLTFSMILMLINIQVRSLDLSGHSVFRQKQKSIPRTRVVLGVKSPVPPSPVDGPRN